MTRPDRAELALACARAGAVLIADETTAELRLDGPEPLAPVAAFDPGGAVVTVGSMSKAGWAGLRLGWIRAAPRIIRELGAIRADVDLASPVLEQLVGIELLGRWDAVLESRRALLRPRRRALLAALPASWAVRRPAGGLSAWVRLPEPVSTRLASAAARAGLRITPGPSFSVDGTFEHHVRLPFTAPPEILEDAIGRLVELAAGLRDARVDPLDVTAAAV